MRIVGLTSGISCGKSTVCDIVRDRNVSVIDLDHIARALLQPGTALTHKVMSKFPEVALADGSIDREALGKIIFSNEAHRRWLNSQTHWRIGVKVLTELVIHFLKGTALVVLDSPLLYESGLNKICDATVAIDVPRDTQVRRLMARDVISKEFAEQKVDAQMPTGTKVARSDFVVDNSGALSALPPKVDDVLKQLRCLPSRWYLDRRKVLSLIVALLLLYHWWRR